MIGTWRQRQAIEGFQTALADQGAWLDGPDIGLIHSATAQVIEVATTVKITQDALDAMDEKVMAGDIHGGAIALLKALGFEVVQ